MIISPTLARNLSAEAKRSNAETSALLWPTHRPLQRTNHSILNIIRNYIFKSTCGIFTSIIGIMSALSLALRVNSRLASKVVSFGRFLVGSCNRTPRAYVYRTRQSFSSKRGFVGLSSSPIAFILAMKTYEDAYPLFWILSIGMFVLGFVVCLFVTEDRWK